MKAFVVGPTGSGKTFAARRLATERGVRYVDYDGLFCPAPIGENLSYPKSSRMKPSSCLKFLQHVSVEPFVMDNVPHDPTWSTFSAWAAQESDDVEVFCVVPESMRKWEERKPEGGHKLQPWMWLKFWTEVFPLLGIPVTYLSSPENQRIGHDEAMERIGMKDLIKRYMRSQDYDYKYQDVPEISHRGYSGSKKSWDNIRGLVDWKSSSVVDCGSFHGFMLFRIGDHGCDRTRVGHDFLCPALTVSRAVNLLRGDSVRFVDWRAGEPLPEADVTLCLNALHHFPDESHPLGTHCPVKCGVEDFFGTIRSGVAIFEAYTQYENRLKDHWPDVSSHHSDRDGRRIYLCRREAA